MKRAIVVFLSVVFLIGAGEGRQSRFLVKESSAQQVHPAPNNAVLGAVQRLELTMSKNIVAGAEEMPSDKYNYRPTPAQNTFRHLIVHIATANLNFCSLMSGSGAYTGPLPKEEQTKEVLVAALKASFDLCTQKLELLDDSKLEDQLTAGRGSVALGTILVTFVQDYGDHYAQEAAYLRSAGLTPPTAQAETGHEQ